MAKIAKRHQDNFKEKKKWVDNYLSYWGDNIKRYHAFTRFVCKSGLTDLDRSVLKTTQKPDIEANMLEAVASRARAEFALYEPDPSIRAAPGLSVQDFTPELLQTMKILEAHLRAIYSDSMNDSLPYHIFTDLILGGFSAMEIFTDWAAPMSMEQNIFIRRTFDPTLCFFDPLARDSHKGDGKFAGQQYALREQEFIDEFGTDLLAGITFTRGLGPTDWSYRNQDEAIVIIADMQEKRIQEKKIVVLSNGRTVTDQDYQKAQAQWELQGRIEQIPQPTGRTRKAKIETIHNFKMCEGGILEHKETDLAYFSTIFVDGNSVTINEKNQVSQMTRPLCFHAAGVQKLMTYTVQTLANEIENMVQSKYMSCIAAINPDYEEAWMNPQKADVLLYNHSDPENPDNILPKPELLNRPPIPGELLATIKLCEEMCTTILGTFSPGSDLNRADESGIAVARLSLLSNQAVMPYVIGYINALNRTSKVYLDLAPKYWKTPRSIPVMSPEGKREYIVINEQSPGSIMMDYDPQSLDVIIDARTSFAMQKEISLNAITRLMSASEGFAAFMNQNGLMTLIDNLDIRGIESLKVAAEEFGQQTQQAQQQQQQLQQQQQAMLAQKQQLELAHQQKLLDAPTDAQLKLMQMEIDTKMEKAKMQLDEKLGMLRLQVDEQIKSAQVAVQQRIADDNFIEIISKVKNSEVDNQVKLEQIDAENTRSAVESAVKISEHLTGAP